MTRLHLPARERGRAACMILSSVIAASLNPLTSRSRSRDADTASAKEPNVAIRLFASGFTSRRGMARNSTSSRSS